MPRFETSDGLWLHFTDDGDGLPLLCLPGLTRTGADFGYLRPHLTGVRMITLDMRGRGGSDRDPHWQNYSVPVECRDILELLDHLRLGSVAIIGTSRGGLQAMGLCASAPERVSAVALNDVGPELDPQGLAQIMTYLGRRPAARTHAAAAKALAAASHGFANVPENRWLEEAQLHFVPRDDGLDITYDPALRTAVESIGSVPDLWPFFDALSGKPLLALRGAGSALLSAETFLKMRARRPDMLAAEIPDRGHVPFLDEPASIQAISDWLETI